jgi:hypothetical protein
MGRIQGSNTSVKSGMSNTDAGSAWLDVALRW